MDKYFVIGNPISHSLSPQIHRIFSEQHGVKLSYQKILAEEFIPTANKLIKQGANGFNITVPFKTDAFNFANKLNENAKLSKAVNVIKIIDNEVCGYNTDGIGLVIDIKKNLKLELKDKTILILGAGGAARGIIPELLKLSPEKLMIANRTADTAKQLALEFSHLGSTCGFGLDKIKDSPIDLIINSTSVAYVGNMPDINPGCVNNSIFYDLSYGKTTDFMLWAQNNNAKQVFDGWGMLIEQAAATFKVWYEDANLDTTELINNPIY